MYFACHSLGGLVICQVTPSDSAISSFDVTPFGIDADHRSMIKFSSSGDADYRAISTAMIRMIKSTLQEIRPRSYTNPSIAFDDHIRLETSRPATSDSNSTWPDINMPPTYSPNEFNSPLSPMMTRETLLLQICSAHHLSDRI